MIVGVDGISLGFEITGVTRYLLSMLSEMIPLAHGDRFIIYSPMPVDLHFRGDNWKVRVLQNHFSSHPTLWSQLVLPPALQEDKIDLFWAQPTYLPLLRLHSHTKVLTLHDLVPYISPESMQLRALIRMRLFLKLMINAADLVVCVSETTARLASQYFKTAGGKLKVVKEAAAAKFRPLDKVQAKQRVKEKFGISGDFFIFVSTIEPRKGHRVLLRAIEQLNNPPLLVLVGSVGWRCQQIMEEIRSAERTGRVRYLGRVDDDDLVALYNAARFSVYPSFYEGFGLPILEAMACGCPVICSDTSSMPEVGGKAAIYFRAGDHESLARTIQKLAADDDLVACLSRQSLEWARNFSFQRAAQEMLSVMREGLKK